MFVVFEGLDKSGKSTTCNSVYAKLQKMNIPTTQMHFPNRTTIIGNILNKYLAGKIKMSAESTHLLFTADRYEKKEYIEKISVTDVLLCDRYSWSGICFSHAKGLDLAWCIETEKLLPKPDITFYLDADVAILMKRHNWGDEVLETKEFQSKAADAYSQIEDFVENLIRIDATKSSVEITNIVVDEILKYKRSKNKQVQN